MTALQQSRFVERHLSEWWVWKNTGVFLAWQWEFCGRIVLLNHE